MTRKHLWRSMARYGDEGPWLVALPSYLRDRYTTKARIHQTRPGVILSLSVTDRQTGATFGWKARADRVTLTMASDATASERDRLWRDGRDIIGLARKQIGRPPGTPNRARAALVAEVRDNPQMTHQAIDRRGVELGIWQDAPGDYDVIRKRVTRLRKNTSAQ